ncbi:MAG: alkane 1-monooxygenase [Rhodanobacteraceae bacterium]|nr:alkane 1-monooxygenase [Rhodanobacteraceae bacterium]
MRPIRHVSRFALAFVPLALLPASALAMAAGMAPALAVLFPLAFLFGLVPLADWALGRDCHNAPDDDALENQLSFRLLTWLMVPAWLLHLAWSIHYVATLPMTWITAGLWIVSLGVVGGVAAINTAHELIHKSTRFEPLLGGLLLSSVIYAGFKVEHLRGHHVHVSTPRDTSSAFLGQSLYHFLPRALLGNALHAWQLEAGRLRGRGRMAWLWRNELMGWYGLSALLALSCGLAWGWKAVAAFVVQGFIAAITLEIINYIEHYGLQRRQLATGHYERVTHHHSWNAAQRLTNSMLFQLQRHADHHAHPRRRYQALRHYEDSPQLPAGYASMFVLALIPPLWRRVVDPRIHEWRHRQVQP